MAWGRALQVRAVGMEDEPDIQKLEWLGHRGQQAG